MRRVQQCRSTIDESGLDPNSQVAGCKSATLHVLKNAIEQFGDEIAEQQEVLGYISDMMIDTYAIESGMLRTQRLIDRQDEAVAHMAIDMTQTYTNDAVARIRFNAQQALAAINHENAGRTSIDLETVCEWLQYRPINTVSTRRRIAQKIIILEEYGGIA